MPNDVLPQVKLGCQVRVVAVRKQEESLVLHLFANPEANATCFRSISGCIMKRAPSERPISTDLMGIEVERLDLASAAVMSMLGQTRQDCHFFCEHT